MTIVVPIMRIVLRMKIIVRCPKSSYHSLHYHTNDNKVKKFLNPSRQLYIDLYQITQSSNFQIKDKIMLNVRNVKKITLERQVVDFMNGFATIVGRIANLTGQNILWKISINKFLLKISVYFEMVTLITKLNEKYRRRCLLESYVLR